MVTKITRCKAHNLPLHITGLLVCEMLTTIPSFTGYYCLGGADTATPHNSSTGDRCPAGSYCPQGSPDHIYCENGTYTNYTGASSCDICPEGYYCIRRSVADPCPPGESHLHHSLDCSSWALSKLENSSCQRCNDFHWHNVPQNYTIFHDTGYYCPYGTGENLQMCPAGTYNPIDNIASEDECTQCDPGTYCQLPGQSNYTGLCAEGYFCTLGMFSLVLIPCVSVLHVHVEIYG